MIVKLSKENFSDFKQYCITHRTEHDESFLYDEDLEGFEIGNDNPTYLLYGDKELKGVCSFIQDAYHLKGNKARVRIFHCKSNQQKDYERLLEKMLPLDSKVERIIMYIPIQNTVSRQIAEKMGFFIERYSYIMERINQKPNEFFFKDGYELTDYVSNKDEDDYLYVRNAAFASLKGSEVPQTKEQVIEYMKPGQILTNGAKILRYNGNPVGIIRMEHELDQGKDYSFVAPLAILPEHQGKGLGTRLLRAGIQIGCDNGYNDCMLAVNAENENALKLYLKEGFEKTFEVACYNLKVK
jgi:mycothiol synthase